MSERHFTGVIPAVVTPFDRDLAVDSGALKRNLSFLAEAGVTGVVVCGTVGEAGSLSAAERDEVVSSAREALDGLQLLVGVSAADGAEAAGYARRAAELGGEGLMCTPPVSYRADRHEVSAFFGEVAAATELPLMVYNNPFNTPTDLSAEQMRDLFEEIESVVAFKELSGDARRIAELIERTEGRADVLVGGDDWALEGLCAGAVGWVSGVANVAPAQCTALLEHCRAGDLDAARAVYGTMLPLARLDMTPKLVQYFKAALESRGLPSGGCRPPRLELRPDERRALDEAMAALGVGAAL